MHQYVSQSSPNAGSQTKENLEEPRPLHIYQRDRESHTPEPHSTDTSNEE